MKIFAAIEPNALIHPRTNHTIKAIMTTETLTPAEIDYRSRAWIAANSVTLDKIHFTPSFKHIGDFANWLANQAEVKPWFAWNGDLHSTRLLLQAGYLTMHAQGRLEHVPGAPT